MVIYAYVSPKYTLEHCSYKVYEVKGDYIIPSTRGYGYLDWQLFKIEKYRSSTDSISSIINEHALSSVYTNGCNRNFIPHLDDDILVIIFKH